MLNVVDIFCGAGGLSAGFARVKVRNGDDEQPAYRILYGVDCDTDAIATFRAFHSRNSAEDVHQVVAEEAYIENITATSIRAAIGGTTIDVLFGGPNCQGVSAAGLRNPKDHRNEMLPAFIRLVEELQPSWFVMENVPGLTHANNRELLCEIFEQFECLGYTVKGDVLLAADYGVPQLRYRLFIIGTNTGAPIRFPLPTHFPTQLEGNAQLPGIADPYRTVRNAIGNLSGHTPTIYDENVTPHEVTLPPGSPHNHYCIGLRAVSLTRIQAIPEGQDWRAMPIKWLPERYFATRASDQKGAYGRLSWEWPAYTITNEAYNVSAGPFTHPEHTRGLSVREAARLQSFDDEHIFFGSVLSQYRQVGNAVPPRLAQAVAESILYCHTNREKARHWGTAGRLDYRIVHGALRKGTSFPTLTRRHVQSSPLDQPERRDLPPGPREEGERISAWDADTRPADPFPEDTLRLRKLAEQPKNYRTAKRAKAIISFLDGRPKTEIVREANASESSVKKWVDGYFAAGIDGWRAYHTPIKRIASQKPYLIERLAKATERVRRTLLTPSKNGMNGVGTPKRLHMNAYLLRLIERFGERSVSQLLQEAEARLEASVGTVYVGDLLAICDVVFDESLLVLEKPFATPQYSVDVSQVDVGLVNAMRNAMSAHLSSTTLTREKRLEIERYLSHLLSAVDRPEVPALTQRNRTYSVQYEPIADALYAWLRARQDSAEHVWILAEEDVVWPNGPQSSKSYAEVYLAYAMPQHAIILDARLWLPRSFLSDRERQLAAKVPASVTYQQKQDLGITLLKTTRLRTGLSSQWLATGLVYGESLTIRDELAAEGWWYVCEITAATRLFAEQAAVGVPVWAGRGKKPSRMRLLPGSAQPVTASFVVNERLSHAWQPLVLDNVGGNGTLYEFAAQRVWECLDDLPGRESWLIAWRRRGVSAFKLALSNAPSAEPPQNIVRAQLIREFHLLQWAMESRTANPVANSLCNWTDWQLLKLESMLWSATLARREERQNERGESLLANAASDLL